MMPILYQCRFFTVYTYGVFVAVAFLVAAGLMTQEARRLRMDENAVYNLCLVLLAAGIIFARLFYVVLRWEEFSADPAEILRLNHGGLVWFGGLTGAIAAGLVFMKIKHLPLLKTLDLVAPYAALGQAIGRFGCFFNGCCYGKEVFWGVYFPVHGARLFPAQLLDAFTLLCVFVVLRLLGRRPQGTIMAAYLMLAGTQRFLLEFVRGDLRPFYFHLSLFQWISLAVFLTGLVWQMMIVSWKKNPA